MRSYFTNLGESEGLEFLKIFKIALKLILSWGPLWVFQKMLPLKQTDIWFDKIEFGVRLAVALCSGVMFRGQNLVKS